MTATAVWAAAGVNADEVAASTQILHPLGAALLLASGFGIATHLIATSLIGARARSLPPWIVAVGLVSALAFVASAVLWGTSFGDAANIVAFVLWCLWILGVSHRLWSRQETTVLEHAA